MNKSLIFKKLNQSISGAFICFFLLIILPQLSAQALEIAVSDGNGGTSFSSSTPGEEINVYINAIIGPNDPPVTAIQFSLTYDPNLLKAYVAPLGSATLNWNSQNDLTLPGKVIKGMYNLTPLPVGTDQIAVIKFKVVASGVDPFDTRCSLTIPASTNTFNNYTFQTMFNNINLTTNQITNGSFTYNYQFFKSKHRLI